MRIVNWVAAALSVPIVRCSWPFLHRRRRLCELPAFRTADDPSAARRHRCRPGGLLCSRGRDLSAGRTEFVPACIVGHGWDGLARIRILDRGGLARLRALAAADGFAEIGPEVGDVPADSLLRFHPFVTSFTL